MADDLPWDVPFRRMQAPEVPQVNIAPYCNDKGRPDSLRRTLDHVKDEVAYMRALQTWGDKDELEPLHEETYVHEKRYEVFGLPVVQGFTMHPEAHSADLQQRQRLWIPRKPLLVDGWDFRARHEGNDEGRGARYGNVMVRVFPDAEKDQRFRGDIRHWVDVPHPAYWGRGEREVPDEVVVNLSYRIQGKDIDKRFRSNGPMTPTETLTLSSKVTLKADGTVAHWSSPQIKAARTLEQWSDQPERTVRVDASGRHGVAGPWDAEVIGLEPNAGDLERVLGMTPGKAYTPQGNRSYSGVSQGQIGTAMLLPNFGIGGHKNVDPQATLANLIGAFKLDDPEAAREALLGFKAIEFGR